MSQASEMESFKIKMVQFKEERVTRESLTIENQALYAKCQMLEAQLEHLVNENTIIKEAQSQELMQDFNVKSYLKWRSSIKLPEIQ